MIKISNYSSPNYHPQEKVSETVKAIINHHCYGNLSEFYRRHKHILCMSQPTFYRAMGIYGCTPENAKKITALAHSLGLVDNEGNSNIIEVRDLLEKLFNKLDLLIEYPSLDNLGKLKEFVDKYRERLLSL